MSAEVDRRDSRRAPGFWPILAAVFVAGWIGGIAAVLLWGVVGGCAAADVLRGSRLQAGRPGRSRQAAVSDAQL